MGLFSKKPKSIIVQKPVVKPTPPSDNDRSAVARTDTPVARPDASPLVVHDAPKVATSTDVDAAPAVVHGAPNVVTPPKADSPAPPVVHEAPKLAPAAKLPPPKPPKPAKQKNRKGGVDPADFLALRSELIHMKARLDESEQQRAIVEARLGALDATAAAFSSERSDISEIAGMVLQLQQDIKERTRNTGEIPVISGPGHDELSAKVDALHNRLFGLQDHGPKIAEFEAQLALLRADLATAAQNANDAPVAAIDPDTLNQLATMQQRLDEVDQLKQRIGAIDQLNQRMDGLGDVEQRLANVDGLAAQLQQLNARVAAQAELGGQLSALRDRVAQLSDQPQGGDDDIRLQLQEIGERLNATDDARSQIGQLAERMSSNDNEARAVREHMALLDQRLTNVSTELANQISELGRDIDGLGQRVPEMIDGSVSDEVVDALRGGQVKLANEQARYEIAFRQDLAALAEQLRRGHG